MPRKKPKKPQFGINWDLVSVKPSQTEIEQIKTWKKANPTTIHDLFMFILDANLKASFSNDKDNDTLIMTITPKADFFEDLNTSFVFRSDDFESLLWVGAYYASLAQWSAMSERPNTDNWQI